MNAVPFAILTDVHQALPFAQVEHQVATIDCQPSNPNGGIMVVVSGALLVSDWIP